MTQYTKDVIYTTIATKITIEIYFKINFYSFFHNKRRRCIPKEIVKSLVEEKSNSILQEASFLVHLESKQQTSTPLR